MAKKVSTFLLLTIFNAMTLGEVKAEEKDLYKFLWLDPDKSVYVLQNKMFPKRGTTYMELGYLSHLSAEYQDTTGASLKVGHFLNEQWAIELMFRKYSNSDNDALTSIREINQTVPFVRRPLQSTSLLAKWSPFYGKINTFNKIFYFDWHFAAGPSLIETESNAKTVADPNSDTRYDSESTIGATVKTGVRFHLNKNWQINIDYVKDFYQAPGVLVDGVQRPDKWRNQSDVIFSIGFSF
ncbi:outer membrane beta-barrel domain-containing protein [Halobacteriovorax sp. GB3]|uniref:outer membrane beta-barrel domain-containing protein n=1 Tax=Halobacteriovorax sp. GB3 TaxID=2719615 RepID=UPI00236002BE|nr:outer membrane beta-barrel domain-containing protein [Halobacteriovorax sp. GB3]MDD0853412.1 outer membrane beta-barrel domain-containing protein [Halobacteriovorax sp. GB3]